MEIKLGLGERVLKDVRRILAAEEFWANDGLGLLGHLFVGLTVAKTEGSCRFWGLGIGGGLGFRV